MKGSHTSALENEWEALKLLILCSGVSMIQSVVAVIF
jgi:hypothetical protein